MQLRGSNEAGAAGDGRNMRVIHAGVDRCAHGVEHVWHRFLATGASLSMLPIRLAFGLIFMAHGAQKLFGWFGGPGLEGAAGGFARMGFEPGWFWAAAVGLTELVGGFLLFIGLATRGAAALIAIVMV